MSQLKFFAIACAGICMLSVIAGQTVDTSTCTNSMRAEIRSLTTTIRKLASEYASTLSSNGPFDADQFNKDVNALIEQYTGMLSNNSSGNINSSSIFSGYSSILTSQTTLFSKYVLNPRFGLSAVRAGTKFLTSVMAANNDMLEGLAKNCAPSTSGTPSRIIG